MREMIHKADVVPRTAGGKVLNLYKQLGETPLERLERLREQKPEYKDEVLSYAGRLDPMAEGVMITLVGSANRMRQAYLDMSKEYTFDVLFGFSTDTYDLLGRVADTALDPFTQKIGTPLTKGIIEKGLNEFRGQFSQEYPPFSSKTVEGKSLFSWAREGKLGGLVLPRKTVTVYDISLAGTYKISEQVLLAYIEQTIAQVHGDFRQEEILRTWRRVLRADGTRQFPCATVKASCSSGTYARSVAHGLGKELGIPALALRILRTKVGDFSSDKSLK